MDRAFQSQNIPGADDSLRLKDKREQFTFLLFLRGHILDSVEKGQRAR